MRVKMVQYTYISLQALHKLVVRLRLYIYLRYLFFRLAKTSFASSIFVSAVIFASDDAMALSISAVATSLSYVFMLITTKSPKPFLVTNTGHSYYCKAVKFHLCF